MASTALTRAIIWRRLAAIRRRFLPPPTPPPPGAGAATAGKASNGPAVATADRPWLTPIIVDYFGRDGSTAMLKLLSSSSEVIVEGGYPFELRQFARALTTDDLRAAWSEYSASLLRDPGRRGSRYYGEKMIDARSLDQDVIPIIRMIVLLRDPRDTYVSIESFSRAVGAEDIGGRGGEEERLERFVERQRLRLGWIATLIEGETTKVVRYEDVAADLPSVARRLSGWLDTRLDPSAVADDFRLRWVHGTSPDPGRSVGRWRSELSDLVATRLERELGTQMRALGFGDWSR